MDAQISKTSLIEKNCLSLSFTLLFDCTEKSTRKIANTFSLLVRRKFTDLLSCQTLCFIYDISHRNGIDKRPETRFWGCCCIISFMSLLLSIMEFCCLVFPHCLLYYVHQSDDRLPHV